MSLIKCRKCGGPHVTLKCGKDNKNDLIEKPQINKKNIVTVRINNLPSDITINELTVLVNEWGKIGRVNINNNESKSGFIDFYYKDEAEYFVKAIDRTPFDNMIITAEIL